MGTEVAVANPRPEKKLWPLSYLAGLLNIVFIVVAIGDLVAFNMSAHLGCKSHADYMKNYTPPQYDFDTMGLVGTAPNADIEQRFEYAHDLCNQDFYTCRAMPASCDKSAYAWAAQRKLDLGKYSVMRPWWSATMWVNEIASIIGSCFSNIGVFLGFLFKIDAWTSLVFWLVPLIWAEVALNNTKKRELSLLPENQEVAIPALSQIGKESALGDAQIATADQAHAALTRRNPSYANEIEFDD